MTALKIGIATYDEMKRRSLSIARGDVEPDGDEPKVWFTSMESLARVLSQGNRELLRVIARDRPASLEELSALTGRAPSNLSRTLKKMAGFGLVRLERGPKGRIAPKLDHERLELDVPLV